jgi:Sulfotransferase family
MDALLMVGEQRSGSNLLRIMLGQADEIAAPHPPHILQRMMPLMPAYKDLEDPDTFAILVDDVCRLVELNPVPWENITRLDRTDITRRCRKPSLIAVFGAVMDVYAEANGKRKWLCKSMTNIRYAKELDAYFRNPKYIYLYRDGRDVALSFMKAVIGDKHPYVITQKWAELQRLCLSQRDLAPERVFSVCYEELTADPETVLRRLCTFLGIRFKEAMLSSHASEEAKRTAEASSLWQNLTKPIMRDNTKKFLKELSEQDIRVIESVGGDCLDELGYERVYVQPGQEIYFDDDEVTQFHAQNLALIRQRRAATDPDDLARRQRQDQVLNEILARMQITSHPHG